MASIFGFEIKRKKPDEALEKAQISVDQPDGSTEIILSPGEANRYYFDWEVSTKDEKEQIEQYRHIAKFSDVDDALDDIVNEAIVVEDQENIVEINLDDTEFSDTIKKRVSEEFEYLLGLLNFHDQGDQIFRQWYIDGKHYYHKVVKNDKTEEGILDLKWLDPIKTKKIREIEKEKIVIDNTTIEVPRLKEEYFIYNPSVVEKKGNLAYTTFDTIDNQVVMKISPDAIAYTTSGLVDLETGKVQSYLHKAIKPANQLSLLEDAMVVYRLVRAPERRIFYIDIGNLGSGRAEQYVKGIMNKYKNKLVYNVETGSVNASRAHLSMMEDIWLPRKEGGRGTEVDTLQGGENLGQIEDVLYFKRRLARSLKVPVSRMDTEGSVFNIGLNGEITRDELKFSKYVDKVRRRFNIFFYDLLKTQLVLKKVIDDDDWSKERARIKFIYNRDSFVAELKKSEMWRRRLELMREAIELTGKDRYFSQRWIRDNILQITEVEFDEIQKDWKKEPKPEPEDDKGF